MPKLEDDERPPPYPPLRDLVIIRVHPGRWRSPFEVGRDGRQQQPGLPHHRPHLQEPQSKQAAAASSREQRRRGHHRGRSRASPNGRWRSDGGCQSGTKGLSSGGLLRRRRRGLSVFGVSFAQFFDDLSNVESPDAGIFQSQPSGQQRQQASEPLQGHDGHSPRPQDPVPWNGLNVL